jgi:hypothetical protein
MRGRVTTVARSTFAGDRVNARHCEGVADIAVTAGAEIAFRGHEQRGMVGRVGGMAIEAAALSRRKVQ